MVQKNIISNIKVLLIICLTALIFCVVLLSLVPPVSKDELVHHLAVPKLYLKHGGIYEIPFMDYSYYPMNLEMLYTVPLFFGNDIIPKFIHFTFALLTSCLIFYYLKRRADTIYALFGAVFFLSIPIILKLSITAYVDLGEIFFSFAALILLLKWIKTGFKYKFLVFSAIMCGLALGTKYSGLVTLAILTFFVPFVFSRYGKGKASRLNNPILLCLAFFLISLLVFSPWMIRDYHWKGNPIYPLYNQAFNQFKYKNGFSDKSDSKQVNYGLFEYRAMVYRETGLQIALLPLRIFFQGKDDNPQYFDGKLNPLLLFLPFWAFYRRKDEPEYLRREKKILLAFSILFFFFTVFTTALRTRYISSIIPPLTVLSSFGILNLVKIAQSISYRLVRNVCIFLVIMVPGFAFAINGNYIREQFKYVNPLPFILGDVSRDQYINLYIPEYSAIRYVNDNLDSKAKVFFVFTGNRSYYCEKDYFLDNDMSFLKKLINNASRPDNILNDLTKLNITHLLINKSLFYQWIKDNFSDRKQVLIKEFFRDHLELMHDQGGFAVLGIKLLPNKRLISNSKE
jgi:4-amino-4-deoxy-L-arabinose transferase-like glycosyltransferase